MKFICDHLGPLAESENFPGEALFKFAKKNPTQSILVLEGEETLKNVPDQKALAALMENGLAAGMNLADILSFEKMGSLPTGDHHHTYHFVYLRPSRILLRTQKTLREGYEQMQEWRVWSEAYPKHFKKGLPYGSDLETFSDGKPGEIFSDELCRLFLSDWQVGLIKKIQNLSSLMALEELPEKLRGPLNQALLKTLEREPELLYRLDDRLFEEMIADSLQKQGWEVELTAKSKDGGYDIFGIQRTVDGERSWIIECKRYSEHRKVGVGIVRSVFGVQCDKEVDHAMIVTSSSFTRGAKQFVSDKPNFDLVNREKVLEWIKKNGS